MTDNSRTNDADATTVEEPIKLTEISKWYQPPGQRIFVSEDALDSEKHSDAMSIGYVRYAAGQSNQVTVTYDEALIVVRGAFSVTDDAGTKTTARVGETIFLAKNTSILYSAEEEAEIAYVTYPRWEQALRSIARPKHHPTLKTGATNGQSKRAHLHQSGDAL